MAPSPKSRPKEHARPHRGFQIGKAKRGNSGVYLGKAQTIKRTLIHKAKFKKQRARELARAGYGAGPSVADGAASDDDDDGGERNPMHDVEDEMQEEEPSPHRRADKGKGRRGNGDVMPVDLDVDEGKRSKKAVKRPASPRSSEDGDREPARRSPEAMAISSPVKGPHASAKPAPKRRRISEAGEDERAVAEAKAAAKARRETARSAWKARNRNGQPKLGKRIGAMLGRIEASVKS